MVGGLFTLPAPDWSTPWVARRTNVETARSWLTRFHYSGNIGHTGAHFYGVFAPDLIAVVGIGPPTNAYGLATRFGLELCPGNREITRVAVHPNSPRNSASRAIATVMRLLRGDGLEWVFAYADSGQGHHGGIYQALNAVYVGVDVGGPPPPAWEIRQGDAWIPIAARTLQRKCGTGRRGAIERLATVGVEVRISDERKPAKHTYIIPIGERRSRAALRKHLAEFALPCGRILVGRGGDTWDPLCILRRGHSGACRPAPIAPHQPSEHDHRKGPSA